VTDVVARDLVERYVADLLNGPDALAASRALLTDDFRFVGPANRGGIDGPDAFAGFQGVMRRALDGLRFDLVEAIVEGDVAALVLRMHGRHVGSFAGEAICLPWLAAAPTP
jgi:SnoaL-like domain